MFNNESPVALISVDKCQMHCIISVCCQNERVLVEAALRELPTRSEAEVRTHAAWYTEYSALVEAKRLAIQQWKKSKEVCILLHVWQHVAVLCLGEE